MKIVLDFQNGPVENIAFNVAMVAHYFRGVPSRVCVRSQTVGVDDISRLRNTDRGAGFSDESLDWASLFLSEALAQDAKTNRHFDDDDILICDDLGAGEGFPGRLVHVDFFNDLNAEDRIAEARHWAVNRKLPYFMSQSQVQWLARLRASSKECLLVGTGPSARLASQMELSEFNVVVCNTVIFDDELMRFLNPQALVFSDPAYHLGPSLYAKQFREKVLESYAEYKFTVLTHEKYVEFLEELLPDLKGAIIGINVGSPDSEANLDLLAANYVKPFANILTLLMLPLAATISDQISLVGFDGRKKGDVGFWTHGKTVQNHQALASVQVCHPGFHSRDKSTYFESHCKNVEALILLAENSGKTVRYLGSSSEIPALQRRLHVIKRPSLRRLIHFAPGAQSNFGHYDEMSNAIREVLSKEEVAYLRATGHPVGSSGPENKEIDTVHLFEQRTSWRPIVSQEKAFHELKMALESLEVAEGDVVFLYEGRLADIPIYSRLASCFPSIAFVFNVFGVAASGTEKPNWRGKANEALDGPPDNLILTADNYETVVVLEAKLNCTIQQLPFFPLITSELGELEGSLRKENRIAVVGNLFDSNRGFKQLNVLSDLAAWCQQNGSELWVKVGVDNPENPSANFTELKKRLDDLQREYDGITISYGWLSRRELLENLGISQVLVLLNNPKVFGFRTSALVYDALVFGTKVLVPFATGPMRSELSNPLVYSFDLADPTSLIETISTASSSGDVAHFPVPLLEGAAFRLFLEQQAHRVINATYSSSLHSNRGRAREQFMVIYRQRALQACRGKRVSLLQPHPSLLGAGYSAVQRAKGLRELELHKALSKLTGGTPDAQWKIEGPIIENRIGTPTGRFTLKSDGWDSEHGGPISQLFISFLPDDSDPLSYFLVMTSSELQPRHNNRRNTYSISFTGGIGRNMMVALSTSSLDFGASPSVEGKATHSRFIERLINLLVQILSKRAPKLVEFLKKSQLISFLFRLITRPR